MYERMLNKQEMPTPEEMTAYCGAAGEWFTSLNALPIERRKSLYAIVLQRTMHLR